MYHTQVTIPTSTKVSNAAGSRSKKAGAKESAKTAMTNVPGPRTAQIARVTLRFHFTQCLT